MATKKQIQPGEKVPLKLTATERKLVLQNDACLDEIYRKIIRDTPTGEPVMMVLDDLADFGSFIVAEANCCDDNKKQKKLDAVYEKVQQVLDTYTDGEPPQTLKIEAAPKEPSNSDEAAQIAEFSAQALMAAEQLRIKTKTLDNLWLAPAQRELLLQIPSLSKTITNKLAKEKMLTVAEVASVTMAMSEDLQNQTPLLRLAWQLMDCLQEEIMTNAGPPAKKKPKRTTQKQTDVLYQFKIKLLGTTPPIWRRIQVQDGTLNKLHEHIQTAMGWTNSHLHQFDIKGQGYGDPELLGNGFADFECEDSTTTMLSEILPKSGKRFAFKYEYDFGDCWEHEVLYEGSPPLEKGKKYPLCLEGERACPPEDVGGVWGFGDFLEAIADPRHEQHDEFAEWAGEFDPDDFDPKKATKEMKKGLPDWRKNV